MYYLWFITKNWGCKVFFSINSEKILYVKKLNICKCLSLGFVRMVYLMADVSSSSRENEVLMGHNIIGIWILKLLGGTKISKQIQNRII